MLTFLIVLAISAGLITVGFALINSTSGKIVGLVISLFVLGGGVVLGIQYADNVLNRTLGEPQVTRKECGTLDYIKSGGEKIFEKIEKEITN